MLQKTMVCCQRMSLLGQITIYGGSALKARIMSGRHRQFDELVLVPIEDILYFRADQKYVTVRHVNGEDLIDESLKSLEEEFEPDFVRIHRSTLAALKHMKSIERDDDGAQYVLLRGDGGRLQVSRRFAGKLKRRLKGSKG